MRIRLDQIALEMARPLGVKGQQRRKVLVPSITMGHELRVESPLEASVARGLDLDPRVIAIRAQPFTVRLDRLQVFDTKKKALAALPRLPKRKKGEGPDDTYVYTPDFHILGSMGRQVVLECKSAADLERIPRKVDRWRRALRSLGYPFRVRHG